MGGRAAGPMIGPVMARARPTGPNGTRDRYRVNLIPATPPVNTKPHTTAPDRTRALFRGAGAGAQRSADRVRGLPFPAKLRCSDAPPAMPADTGGSLAPGHEPPFAAQVTKGEASPWLRPPFAAGVTNGQASPCRWPPVARAAKDGQPDGLQGLQVALCSPLVIWAANSRSLRGNRPLAIGQ
jgi:hypothetical protein